MNSDHWDSRYAEAQADKSTVWSLEPNAWIAQTVGGLTPGTAVDLGAGEGRNALWLASVGWTVTAVDFSSVGLATGAQRAQQLGLTVNWVTADATQWIAPEPVDLVVIAYLQLAPDAAARMIHNAAASLAPGGLLVFIGHHRDNLVRGVGGPQNPAVLYTEPELRDAAADLDILECGEYERVTAGGQVAIDAILIARSRGHHFGDT